MAATPTDPWSDIDAVERLSRPELEARAKALRTINAIADAILATAGTHDILGQAIEALARFTRFASIALFAVNEEEQRLDLLSSRGFDEATLLAAARLKIDGSLTGIAVRAREMVTSSNVSADDRTEPTVRERLAEEGFAATVSVPLLVGERAVGALNLIYKGDLRLAEYERLTLTAIARTMAIEIERTRYVRAIDLKRQQAQATLASIGDGVLSTDALGRVRMMNREAERLTGWTEVEARGHPVEDLFCIRAARTRQALESPVARSLRQREVVRLADDPLLISRDGTEHNVAGSCAPVFDSSGDPVGAVLAFQDVTRARRDRDWLAFMHETSLLLARSLDYETTLAKVAHLAVASLADTCVVDIVQPDGSIRRLAGAHTDPTKQPLIDAFVKASRLDPEAPGGYAEGHSDAPAGGLRFRGSGPPAASDPEFLSALQALHMNSCLAVPLLVDGKVQGAIALASRGPNRFEESDVQRAQQLAHCFALAIENARLHREVRDALAVREEFLSLASHELRTPMTALQLDLAALERAHLNGGDPTTGARIGRAMQQARRLATLSETLVTVTGLSAGRTVLHLEEGDLRELVADAVARCRQDGARAGCTIELLPGPALVVRCDRRRMEQAVRHLVANATKYGQGRPVELALEASDGAMARINVTDHGIGIPHADRGRIFELFERAVPSRHYAGLGLGLYVARETVRAHGGSILVASEPDAGSTFTVVLPVDGRG